MKSPDCRAFTPFKTLPGFNVQYSTLNTRGHFFIGGQFHRSGRYIQTKFLNFNPAQINVLKELSSFPFMNMFMPTDILIGL